MVLNVIYLKGKVQVGLKKYQGRKPFIKGWNESSKWRSLKQAKCCQDRGKINLNIRRCQPTVNDYEGARREQERGKRTFPIRFMTSAEFNSSSSSSGKPFHKIATSLKTDAVQTIF